MARSPSASRPAVIVMSGHGTIDTALQAIRSGALDFLEKPITADRLLLSVQNALRLDTLSSENERLRAAAEAGLELLGESAPMEELRSIIARAAPTDATVLVTGENGTGKELVAQAIHQNSPRKGKRIVALNIAAVAQNLVESELFGHVKGAFTDALADRVGAFEYAHGGTLFFDEVGDMPISTQIKLLRVLEEHTITRVGDNKQIKVNARVLSATNRMVADSIWL